VKFKLDENLSPSLAELFTSAGHDAHSVVDQGLGGATDPAVLLYCTQESRVLVTFDLDFTNIQAHPPGTHAGIVVLRLATQSHALAAAALVRVLALLPGNSLAGSLWIVEDHRVRIRD
jgi:predicted nuclease of predicted toxin-antitoxin system